MKIKSLAICLFLTTACHTLYAQTNDAADQQTRVRKRMEIDVRPKNRSLVGCLQPAFRAAGRNWSTEFLYAFGGQAFVFNMSKNGRGMWHTEEYVYGVHFLDMLAFLGDDFEMSWVILTGENPSTIEEMNSAKTKAWDTVRTALDAGLPSVVWQPIDTEMAIEHPNPRLMRLPAMWSLIVGYDELAETYIVDSSASRGRFTIGRNAFGHIWPASKLFCVITVKPETGSFDAYTAHRTVIQRAIEASQGQRPGNKNATYHGLVAWEIWLDMFQKGTVNTSGINNHADFLKASRSWSSAYFKKIVHHFPKNSQAALQAAAEHYQKGSEAMENLLALEPYDTTDIQKGAELVSRALKHERAALASLQQVLDAK